MSIAPLQFETFELVLGPKTSKGYTVQVIDSPAGSVATFCLFSPTIFDFQNMLSHANQAYKDPTTLDAYGTRLFQELFVGQVASLYRSSLGHTRSHRQGLRIRLRIEPSELSALPWEYLYDPEEEIFLAISAETPLVRTPFMSNAAYITAVDRPLRILVVLANPRDMVTLDLVQERQIIQQALEDLVKKGLVKFQVVEQATIERINHHLRSFRPHVFHFAGHGLSQGDRAFVMLEQENGLGRPMHEKAFCEFFRDLFDIRVAVLNACQSATISSARPLVGIAQRILQRNLSAVIAMQQVWSDRAALIFTREFYRCLASGYPIDVAVAEARKGIFQEEAEELGEWGVPVTFLRARDGQLFQIKVTEDLEIYIFNQTLAIQHLLYVNPTISGRQLYAQVRSTLKLPYDVSELNGRVGFHFEYELRYGGCLIAEEASLQDVGIINGSNLDLEITITPFAPGIPPVAVKYRDSQLSTNIPKELEQRLLIKALGHLPSLHALLREQY